MQGAEQRRLRVYYHMHLAVMDRKGSHEIIDCETVNISLNGVLVRTAKKLPIDDSCMIHLILPDSSIKLVIEGKVVRHTLNGMALTFEKMDLETQLHLKNIIMANAEDPDAVSDQCDEKPGFK